MSVIYAPFLDINLVVPFKNELTLYICNQLRKAVIQRVKSKQPNTCPRLNAESAVCEITWDTQAQIIILQLIKRLTDLEY